MPTGTPTNGDTHDTTLCLKDYAAELLLFRLPAYGTPAGGVTPPRQSGARHRFRGGLPGLRRFSLVYVGLATVLLFSVLTPGTFLTAQTWKSIVNEQAITCMVALGLLVPLSAGAFDLSVGWLVGIGGVGVAWLLTHGVATVPAIGITLAGGVLVGVANGALVVGWGIDSFIATLGMGSILSAAIGWISGNQFIVGLPNSFASIALTQVDGFSLPVAYLLVIAFVLWFLLNHTPSGRRIYATGGARDAARLSGVRTSRIVYVSFLVSALLATVAGVVLTASLTSASSSVGPDYLLPAFAAAFLGSTQVIPGRFNVWGTVLAVYVLAIGVKGLQLLGAAFWVPDLFNGVALIAAVGLSIKRPHVPAARIRARLNAKRTERQTRPT